MRFIRHGAPTETCPLLSIPATAIHGRRDTLPVVMDRHGVQDRIKAELQSHVIVDAYEIRKMVHKSETGAIGSQSFRSLTVER